MTQDEAAAQLRQWASSELIREQIAARIAKPIVEGTLKPGEQPPDTAELAVFHEVSGTTVRTAKGIIGQAGLLRKDAADRWVVADWKTPASA